MPTIFSPADTRKLQNPAFALGLLPELADDPGHFADFGVSEPYCAECDAFHEPMGEPSRPDEPWDSPAFRAETLSGAPRRLWDASWNAGFSASYALGLPCVEPDHLDSMERAAWRRGWAIGADALETVEAERIEGMGREDFDAMELAEAGVSRGDVERAACWA